MYSIFFTDENSDEQNEVFSNIISFGMFLFKSNTSLMYIIFSFFEYDFSININLEYIVIGKVL